LEKSKKLEIWKIGNFDRELHREFFKKVVGNLWGKIGKFGKVNFDRELPREFFEEVVGNLWGKFGKLEK